MSGAPTKAREPGRDLHQTPTGKVHVWEDDGTSAYICGVLEDLRDHFHTGPVTCGNCLRIQGARTTDSAVGDET